MRIPNGTGVLRHRRPHQQNLERRYLLQPVARPCQQLVARHCPLVEAPRCQQVVEQHCLAVVARRCLRTVLSQAVNKVSKYPG